MKKKKGLGIPIVAIVEGGHSIEDVQRSLAKKLKTINTKDFPSLNKFFKATDQLASEDTDSKT